MAASNPVPPPLQVPLEVEALILWRGRLSGRTGLRLPEGALFPRHAQPCPACPPCPRWSHVGMPHCVDGHDPLRVVTARQSVRHALIGLRELPSPALPCQPPFPPFAPYCSDIPPPIAFVRRSFSTSTTACYEVYYRSSTRSGRTRPARLRSSSICLVFCCRC